MFLAELSIDLVSGVSDTLLGLVPLVVQDTSLLLYLYPDDGLLIEPKYTTIWIIRGQWPFHSQLKLDNF